MHVAIYTTLRLRQYKRRVSRVSTARGLGSSMSGYFPSPASSQAVQVKQA
jgi:hypothetical protein